MKVLIFGFGNHGGGFAAAQYFLKRGDQVRITDMNSLSKLGDSIQICSDMGAELILEQHRESDFTWADCVVKSPAISKSHPFLIKSHKIINDFSTLFSFVDIDKIKLIAITGTKGKTTTASAVTHVLQRLGHEAIMCGNMGISGFSVLEDLEERSRTGKELPEYIVCEMSSWQISDTFQYLDHVPVLEASCMTSLYEDHQNYYHSMESYIKDKMQLFRQKSRHIISTDSMRQTIASASDVPLSDVMSIEKTARKLDSSILAPAYAICSSLGFGSKRIIDALKTFPGVPHRNEMVRFHNNTIFINDSAATVPEAVQFTYSNYYSNVPVFLICGGTDKELHPEGMTAALRHSIGLYLLGGSFTSEKLIPLLQSMSISYHGPYCSMDDAVDASYSDAQSFLGSDGNTTAFIILSPGAASFELFRHEFDRGDKFKQKVNSIAN